MKIFVPDTNIFLRYFLNDLPEQADLAKQYFEKAKKEEIKLIVTSITIFEVIFALDKVYKFEKTKIIELIKAIVSASYLEIEEREVFLRALKLYSSANVDFVDTFVFSKAKSLDGEVISFDKDIKKLSKINC